MKEVFAALLLVAAVIAVTVIVQKFTMFRRKAHKTGVIVIPVTGETENIDFAVKSAYYDETFDSTPCGREILIVDFGCKPQMWEHYRLLASEYSIVHAISCNELYAYLKVKYG